MEKSLARFFSVLFNPLLMTSLGMLILFNSGTSLSVVQPEVKYLSLAVTALFTLFFPALMIFILYLTRVLTDISLQDQKERVLPITLTIIMYMFTFFVLRNISQLSGGHIVFLFCSPAALFIALILNNFMKPSIHMLGMGVLLGIILVLILFYGAQIQILFIIAVLATGIVGSSRMLLKYHSPREVFLGFMAGFLGTGLIMMIFIF